MSSKLEKLDLSSFDTSNVTNMYLMFGGDTNLTEIIFGDNFKTSKVENMRSMFQGCNSLTTLDLSNFTGEKLTNMTQMFWPANNLTKIDMSNLNLSGVTTYNSVFVTNVLRNAEIIVNNCSGFTSKFGTNFTNVHLANGTSCSA